ncbi:6-phosphogluconolactonase [Caulobacter sp. S45]|uniref:6-phosphogluconolactonase n=1 Tax=Caulobacter sp. S45 TaxID=1641861 RepID=UPI00131CBD15|nr:6-phosphogluconolactonase [Caulobacter sp. S45]
MNGRAPEIRTWPDPAALAQGVADWLLDLVLAKTGVFSLCLSGGSTPKALYHLLGRAPYRDCFPWERIHLFWGDERFVPADDALSNYRMVRETLLDLAPIPPGNVHPVPTWGADPEVAAAAYQKDLQAFYGADRLDPTRPLFDVNLLGLGADGHTASLFPDTKVLAERTLWVDAVVGAKAEARISLTYPALESSRHAAFLVAGKEKAAVLARVLHGDESLPAANLHPTGDLWVFCDTAAQGAP